MSLFGDKDQASEAKAEGKVGQRQVRILKYVGQHKPGDIVWLPEDEAAAVTQSSHVHDGVNPIVHQKAMYVEDYDALEASESDPNKMTMKDLADRHMKNVVDSSPAEADLHKAATAEKLNLDGVPVSSSEPFVTTGGITPPTTVIPSLAKAAGRASVSAEDIFGTKGAEAGAASEKEDGGKAKAAADKKAAAKAAADKKAADEKAAADKAAADKQ